LNQAGERTNEFGPWIRSGLMSLSAEISGVRRIGISLIAVHSFAAIPLLDDLRRTWFEAKE
jgi:hypothetical protein